MSAAPMRLVEARTPVDPLLARAKRLWPDNDYLQREWLRAVRVVRKTAGGWNLDRQAGRVS